jgi:YHS domain-containing protein
MNTHTLHLAAAFAIALFPGIAVAQHEGHQAADGQALPDVAQCARVQPVVDNIIAAATARLETARQSNNPTEMRAAVEQSEGVLRDIRAQLAPCAAISAPTPSEGAHSMPGMQRTPEAGAAPAAPMDHSKMPMGTAPATKPGAATGTKPAVPAVPMDHSKMPMGGAPATKPRATGTKSAKPAAPMDHSKMPMGGQAQPGKVMDPVNGLRVDPATAPKTTYQGQTYYFSSEQTRTEFLENPAKFSKKPKG